MEGEQARMLTWKQPRCCHPFARFFSCPSGAALNPEEHRRRQRRQKQTQILLLFFVDLSFGVPNVVDRTENWEEHLQIQQQHR
jgi:hypothetical protein